MKKAVLVFSLAVGLSAIVALVGCESSNGDDNTVLNDLTLAPTDVTIPAGTVTNVLFTATKGTGVYSWQVDTPSLGSIVVSGGSAIYTSTTNSGINYIHLVDSSNNTITASIKQQ